MSDSIRARIAKKVSAYAFSNDLAYPQAWGQLYRAFQRETGHNLVMYQGESKMDICENRGWLEKLAMVAQTELRIANAPDNGHARKKANKDKKDDQADLFGVRNQWPD